MRLIFPDSDMLQNHGDKHIVVLAQEQRYIQSQSHMCCAGYSLSALPGPFSTLLYSTLLPRGWPPCIALTLLPCPGIPS